MPYTNLELRGPEAPVKGSLDPFALSDGCDLDYDNLDIGEAHVSSYGLLHPETACKCCYELTKSLSALPSRVSARFGIWDWPNNLIIYVPQTSRELDWHL